METKSPRDEIERGVTRTIAEFISATRLTDIPDEVLERATHLTLDGLACALVGARLPWSERAVDGVVASEGTGQAAVVGWDLRVPASAAALLNSTFIQGFELDDQHELGGLHTESVVIPPALAAAQTAGNVSGADLLLGICLGLEIGPRIGVATNAYDLIRHGWHSGAVLGALPAATAAAKVRGLDADQVEDALGIAATQASGLMAVQFESMVKRMNHGFGARNGVIAAALAARGFTGIKAVLERPFGGYFATFAVANDNVDIQRAVANLGEDWELTRILVKPFSSGGTTHPTADAMIRARNELGIRPDDVKSITIGLAEAAFKHNGWKLERPATPIAAQLNVAYVGAVALLEGEVFVKQFAPDRLDDPAVWSLVQRTTARWDPSLDAHARETPRATVVEIETNDGTVHRMEVLEPRGFRSEILKNDEVLEKFRALCGTVMDEGRVKEIEAQVFGLRDARSVDGLVAAIEPAVSSPFA